MLSFSSMVTFKLPLFSNYTFFFLLSLSLLSLCSAEVLPTTLYLPVSKDSSTLQYITVIGQRTPLISVKLTVHLGGISLWVDCDRGYNSSTYQPARCNSTLCSFAKSHSCGDCIFKPQLQPGCNNNTCYNWGENPLINTYMDRAEIAEDVLAIGSTPGILVTWPRFIFSCVDSSMSKDLAEGVTGTELYCVTYYFITKIKLLERASTLLLLNYITCMYQHVLHVWELLEKIIISRRNNIHDK